MPITNKQLVDYARGQLGRPYWYATYGTVSSVQLYNSIASRYPEKVKKWPLETYMNQLGQKVHDCSGLIKGAIFCNGVIDAAPKYNCKYDYSANGIISICEETGPYEEVPNIPGLVLWKPGHVGILVKRTGNVMQWIEAKGHMHGVVEKTDGQSWQKWGRLPASWIKYEDIPAPTPEPDPEEDYIMLKVKELKKGMKDPNVLMVQSVLKAKNYKGEDGKVLALDSSYGKNTKFAVESFQKAKGLKVDGICGEKTWNALANT